MNLPWFVVCVLITLLILGLLWAITNGLINITRPEAVLSIFLYRKKGMEADLVRVILYILIVVALSMALFYALDQKGFTELFANMPIK
ncbi:MAG: hypothetical protein QXD48_01030 [Candidatus Aenigmatarchaeota archaeon]